MALHLLHHDWRPVAATALGLWAGAASVWAGLDLSQGAVAGTTATLAAVGAGIIWLLGQFDRFRQKSRQEWDAINKDSLAKHLQSAVEDRERIRVSLHEIRNRADAAVVEAANLRNQLNETTEHMVDASRELHEANDRIAQLTREIFELRKQSAGQPGRTADAVMAAIGRSQDAIPVVTTPAPAPNPEVRP
jgi:septal ring factor EnvC (AmiA/AmiB activator)